MDAKYERKNDRKKIKKISVWGRFWQGFGGGLGGFGGYKNKMEKKLRKRRAAASGIVCCS